jgi:hypothetical protein
MYSLMAAGAASRDAARASSAATRSSQRASAAEREVSHLEQRLDRLLLVSMSLWELLKERTSLTEEDLMAKVKEIDLRDGQPDGRVSPTVKKCHQCDRTMSPRHQKCLYCGAEALTSSAFESAG